MDIYTLIATVSLVLQIAVLILLFGSLGLKGRKKLRQHGITMLIAVVLHTISILAVMIPSFGVITSGDFPVLISAIAYVHGITGIIAEVFGVWIIATWRLRTSLQYCAPKKKLMRLTLILWLIALFLGILLYLHFYTTLLPL
ncbi:hypothetical protein JXA31_00960 [Candidatus Bathyarchaeota archaeon]|nr:hypothetical protein [Candidatus Bathyarchaeota archaeon]